MSVAAVVRQGPMYTRQKCDVNKMKCSKQGLAKHVKGVTKCCPKSKTKKPQKQKSVFYTTVHFRRTRGQDPDTKFVEVFQLIALL